MVGLCPFHEERTPSFSVEPTEKLYHCFGCGVGGDVIKFVEEKEGVGFGEAVELLADRYGVELQREKEDPREEERRRRRQRIGELLARTASFYGSFLWEAREAAKARSYLAGRGLGRGGAEGVRRRLRAERLGPGADARPAGRLRGRRDEGGGPRPERAAGWRIRPLPEPDHVPDMRPPRPGAGVRGEGDALRAGGEVHQHLRDGPVPQESHPLRRGPRQGGDRQGRARGRRGGLHRRAGAPPGGDRGGGGGDGHGDHRGADSGALGDGRGSRAGARRRLGRAGGDAAGAAGRGESPDEDPHRSDAGGRGSGGHACGRGWGGSLPGTDRRGRRAARVQGDAGARGSRRALAGGARPGPCGGGPGARRDGRVGQPRRSGAQGLGEARPRPGDGAAARRAPPAGGVGEARRRRRGSSSRPPRPR